MAQHIKERQCGLLVAYDGDIVIGSYNRITYMGSRDGLLTVKGDYNYISGNRLKLLSLYGSHNEIFVIATNTSIIGTDNENVNDFSTSSTPSLALEPSKKETPRRIRLDESLASSSSSSSSPSSSSSNTLDITSHRRRPIKVTTITKPSTHAQPASLDSSFLADLLKHNYDASSSWYDKALTQAYSYNRELTRARTLLTKRSSSPIASLPIPVASSSSSSSSIASSSNETREATPKKSSFIKPDHLSANDDVAVPDDCPDKDTCQICFANYRQLMFVPCGHLFACIKCTHDYIDHATRQVYKVDTTSLQVPCPMCKTSCNQAIRVIVN